MENHTKMDIVSNCRNLHIMKKRVVEMKCQNIHSQYHHHQKNKNQRKDHKKTRIKIHIIILKDHHKKIFNKGKVNKLKVVNMRNKNHRKYYLHQSVNNLRRKKKILILKY